MEDICNVCSEPLDQDNVSICALCGSRFHMAWSVDAEIENCGRIWFDESSYGMSFICNICLSENPHLAPLIVDTEQERPPTDPGSP